MQVSVRLSSGLAQSLGGTRLQVSLAEGATVADLLDKLSMQHPDAAQHLASTVAVVSGRHVSPTEPLSSGQEVALLIPIAGGGF